ncbi:MAG: hypothetical protein Q8R35_02115 [bacterium]|nr:hypothetical protein [bacterium]
MGQAIIASMTFYKSLQETRVPLALRTAEEAQKYGYPLVVVDGGSPPQVLEALRARGTKVHPQEGTGLGAAHRQLFSIAAGMSQPRSAIDWIEIEKWPLVSQLYRVNSLILDGEADLVFPSRTPVGWKSYPPEQYHQEKLCNMAAAAITGYNLDWFWGPFAANLKALQHFIEYRDEYGGTWDARTIPRLRVIAAGLKLTGVPVPYTHPPEQTAEETGVLEPFIMRRVRQVCEQVPAMYEEAKKLNILAKRS